MVASPLFDVVMSSGRAERSVGVAKQLVESALAGLSQIERLDDALAPSDAAQFERQTAALVRGMYEQWAHDAQSLLARVAQVERRFGPVPSSLTLRDAHGRTMAMLSISLDDMEAARSEVASGRLASSEQVRRELHLGVH